MAFSGSQLSKSLLGYDDGATVLGGNHHSQFHTQYYSKGFLKLKEGNMFDYACTCALVSLVADAVLTMILDDSRAAMYCADWQTAAEGEVQWLTELDEEVWDAFASRGLLKQLKPHEAYDKVVQGAYVSLAFMDQEIFQCLRAYPWCLCQGNIQDNFLPCSMGPMQRRPQPLKYRPCSGRAI